MYFKKDHGVIKDYHHRPHEFKNTGTCGLIHSYARGAYHLGICYTADHRKSYGGNRASEPHYSEHDSGDCDPADYACQHV